MKRREFIKAASAAGTASLLSPDLIFGQSRPTAAYFQLHPFVDAHPEAVFIKLTQVSDKTAAEEKVRAGHELAGQLFVTSDVGGYAMGSKIAIKPNLTCLGGNFSTARMGIATDADFVAGFIEAMKDGLGMDGSQFYLREGNLLGDAYCPQNEVLDWYGPMAERVGAHLTDFDSGRPMAAASLANLEEGAEVIWREVPNGVIFQRIGYVAPMNAADAFNINIAKFKAHGMGITLSSKNWQGTNVHPYVHYCESLSRLTRGKPASFVNDVHPEFAESVTALHDQHREAGVPRWDRPGSDWNSGWGMEGWAQKTLDNLSASSMDLAMIEGIYGRDGNWMDGPHSGSSKDFMTNVVIFGRNPIKVDIIGHWLAGHEPGNFGLFHSAMTRGLSDTVDPEQIPVYAWESGQPQRRELSTFERTPLMTYYLNRDYDGQDESHWHMVDEPFEYPVATAVVSDLQATPQSHVLAQNYPNPFNASTLIEYRLPQATHARIEIFNGQGQLVEVLKDGWHAGGSHVVSWDSGRRATGTYFYRFSTSGFNESRKMLLVR
ncbi:MAG TPA: DUF362 domain-containing protein [Candidatus Latescibacteria bacterium]|nr:DUF362 domain-containing protein [Candidatus Latescibacterota bacterium]